LLERLGKLLKTSDTWEGSPYFTKKELACKCGCGGLPEREFVERLVVLRRKCGFAFIVTSGYRCPKHNYAVTKNKSQGTGWSGPHTMGRAVDLAVYGEKVFTIIKEAVKLGFTGIGLNQKGTYSERYIHLDDLDGDGRPTVWTY
jgi:zinc D-Ala-D-Ala carboxypeptidase